VFIQLAIGLAPPRDGVEISSSFVEKERFAAGLAEAAAGTVGLGSGVSRLDSVGIGFNEQYEQSLE